MRILRNILVLIFILLISDIFPAVAETEEKEPETLFVMGIGEQELSFNPVLAHTSMEIQVLTALYEGLLTYHPFTLEPVPGTAYKWIISENKLKYNFFIRDNACYSNGEQVEAFHFVDTFLYNLDPKVDAGYSVYLDVIKGAKDFREGKNTDPSSVGIRAVSEKELEFTLNKPASHFLKILCLLNFAPIHPSYKNKKDWDKAESLITNGPFSIYSRTAKEIVLSKNKYYWDTDQVKIDGIKLMFFDDPELLAKEVNIGKIHWTSLNYCSYQDLDAASREKIIPNSMFATSFLFFVCNEKPWDNPKVRKGLALLMPWKELRSQEYSLYPTNRLVPEIPKYPEVKGISQSTEEGLKLLEEAGYPKGKGLPPLVILVTKNGTFYADKIKESWEKVLSLEVKYKEVESREYFSALREHDYTVSSYTWIGDFADPLAFLQMWTSESNLNEALYFNKDYDSLIEESLSVIGLDRYKKLAAAEELLLQQATIMPIDHIAAFNVLEFDIIGGWFPNPLDIHPLKYIEFRGSKMNKWIARDNGESKEKPTS
ncbi:MAG: peptide ABC transporter substrate-binding protein [Spirochaetales bacterium]|nr:peptide ABC transporter substrate-binding protein [Spirochaetales bacterium]